jgi:hypothetical protein
MVYAMLIPWHVLCRVYYLLATVTGYRTCAIPTGFSVAKNETRPESVWSALIWRSGIIGLLWYPGGYFN